MTSCTCFGTPERTLRENCLSIFRLVGNEGTVCLSMYRIPLHHVVSSFFFNLKTFGRPCNMYIAKNDKDEREVWNGKCFCRNLWWPDSRDEGISRKSLHIQNIRQKAYQESSCYFIGYIEYIIPYKTKSLFKLWRYCKNFNVCSWL
jgi:hypothetical protein